VHKILQHFKNTKKLDFLSIFRQIYASMSKSRVIKILCQNKFKLLFYFKKYTQASQEKKFSDKPQFEKKTK
jgi:hypothetical protein